MRKRSKTFRINEDTFNKLAILEQKEKEKDNQGLKALTLTEIVEAAIDLYYTTYLDQDAGDEYMRRITTVIQSSLDQYFNNYDLLFNNLLENTNSNKEALKMLLRVLRNQ